MISLVNGEEPNSGMPMVRDIRNSALYKEAEAIYTAARQPGTGQISDAAELSASPDGKSLAFAGALMDRLEGAPATRICLTMLATGDTRVLTFGPNVDRLPRFSPEGTQVAFLSDRAKAGDFQLYLLDPVTGAARETPRVDGWVEYLHWSPDGQRILLGVAGHGADVAGGQGAVTSNQLPEDRAPWMPTVETGDESFRWRRAWVYELATNTVRQVSRPETNVWEGVWCGNETLAAVVSAGPGEGLWYSARLALIKVTNGAVRALYTPKDQLGWPAASPSGRHLAIVEAVCSDRWIVAGELRLIDTTAGRVQSIDTHGIDIAYTEWRSDQYLLLAGHRGFETVVGLYDATRGVFREVWSSTDITTAGRYVTVSGIGVSGDCAIVGEHFKQAPEIAVIRAGHYRPCKSFDLGYASATNVIQAVDQLRWKASDGLEIQGYLLRPQGSGPHPLVMIVHGGPVWQTRPTWLGRGGASALMLLKRGYALFYPNPRGSSGRGQAHVRRVVGDIGGADTYDYLAGLDHLVSQGIADPQRLGVTGGSYGGFMTSWLISQDPRFAAAVSVAPHNNQVTEHLIGNIPHFVEMFVGDKFNNPGGKYFERSPIMHAHKVKTPTLHICGALDRCTPPEEAVQFHHALLENNVASVLLTYPEEGHGIRKYPAAIDYAARVVGWFGQHMGRPRERR